MAMSQESAKKPAVNPRDLLTGGILQCMEAASVGMPFEVWKTHMGTYRSQGTWEALASVHRSGGVWAFYTGLQPKLVESFLKGGVLLFCKETIISALSTAGCNDSTTSIAGGFGGGVSQVIVMAPCTYLG